MNKLFLETLFLLSASYVYAQANGQECTDIPPEGELSCAERKANGGCDKPFMISGGFCSISCGRCSTPNITEGCSDVTPEGGFTCAERALFGACNKAWLVSGAYCQKTCGYCFSPEDCFDVTPPYNGNDAVPDCETRQGWGGCAAAFMRDNNYCAATCGFCGDDEQDTDMPEDMEIIMTEGSNEVVPVPEEEGEEVEIFFAPFME